MRSTRNGVGGTIVFTVLINAGVEAVEAAV